MTLNTDEIQQLIPHRPPFLWVDEVVEIDVARIVARKRIDAGLDVFAGHYPHFPVLPGVLACEAAFQTGAILIAKHHPPEAGRVPVVTRVNDVKFRRMVRPGETIEMDVELTERLADAFFLKARVSVDGQTAVRLEFACTLAPAE